MTDLFDLVEALKAETNIPGADALENATEDDYLLRLQNAFWEAFLDKVINNSVYTEADGIVTPDLPRELQQLVIIYASFGILFNVFSNLQTKFRTKAGPVEYEIEQSATLLKSLLDKLYERKKRLMEDLTTQGYGGSYMFDQVLARDAAFVNGTASFVTAWTN